MSDGSRIEWTDHTFNPWWGCAHVSPGCVNCYAEAFAKRTGHDAWGAHGTRRMFGDKHWGQPEKWNAAAERAGTPAKVFCASMADVFEDRSELAEQRDRLWGLIERTPWLRWQLLTKRPENVVDMVPWRFYWPRQVWLGTTVEDQRRADERIPVLVRIPAAVHFLSCEPLLGPVDLFRQQWDGEIDWVIAGGESGRRARPMHPSWARDLRDQCRLAGIPFLFKQWGEWGLVPRERADGRLVLGGGITLAYDGTVYRPGDLVWPDGPRRGEAIRADHGRAQLHALYRVGKHRAGRELDGRTWDEFPAAAS